MKTKGTIKKLISSFLIAVMVCVLFSFPVSATAYNCNDHYSFDTAYNMGAWNTAHSYSGTFPQDVKDNYYKFTANAGDKVGIRVSCEYPDVDGLIVRVYNAAKTIVAGPVTTLSYDPGLPILKFIFVKFDVQTSGTYYIRVERTSNLSSRIVRTVSFVERNKTTNGTFTFPGTATNPGNPIGNTAGTYSNVLSLDLTNNTSIPADSVVMSVTTSATFSPNLGNTYCEIKPPGSSAWYRSVISGSSGAYTQITESLNIPLRGIWQFRYNTLSAGSSTMKNVTLTVKYKYDPTNLYVQI